MKRVRAQSAPRRPAEIPFDNPLKSTLKNDTRILRRCPNEDQHPAFNRREKSILLSLVEAMRFIDEQHGAALLSTSERLRLIHRRPQFAHPGQHRREPNKLGLAGARHPFRQRGLAGSRGTPQHHGMGLAALNRQAQRLTRGGILSRAVHRMGVQVQRLRVGGRSGHCAGADGAGQARAAGLTASAAGLPDSDPVRIYRGVHPLRKNP